jgi:hypothetical protein
MSSFYDDYVKNKTAEQILSFAGEGQAGKPLDYNEGQYIRIAAQVRSNGELIAELKRASASNEKVAVRLVYLTGVLVSVGVLQFIAIAWPYLSWWFEHDFRFK